MLLHVCYSKLSQKRKEKAKYKLVWCFSIHQKSIKSRNQPTRPPPYILCEILLYIENQHTKNIYIVFVYALKPIFGWFGYVVIEYILIWWSVDYYLYVYSLNLYLNKNLLTRNNYFYYSYHIISGSKKYNIIIYTSKSFILEIFYYSNLTWSSIKVRSFTFDIKTL